MLFISRLKRSQSCFSLHFCFLLVIILLSIVFSVSFLMVVISPFRAFLCSPRVVVSMCQHCLHYWQEFFLHPVLIPLVCHSRLWDVMSYPWSLVFILFGPFFLSFSPVNLKKGSEYLTRSTARVFIPLLRILLDSFDCSSFLVLLRYSFLIFFYFLATFLMVSASKMPSMCRFPSLQAF